MKIMQKTSVNKRMTLHVTRQGVEARYLRPAVIEGGFFVENSVLVAWPWVKLS